jgi:hypothetical protein
MENSKEVDNSKSNIKIDKLESIKQDIENDKINPIKTKTIDSTRELESFITYMSDLTFSRSRPR